MPSKRSAAALLSIAAVIVIALPLGAGFLSRIHPAFDSLAEFRAHLAALLAFAACAALLARERLVAGLALVLAAAALLSAAGSLDRNRVPVQPSGGPAAVYSFLQLNLFEDNQHPERALSLIGRLHPDVITVEEVTDAWAERLALLKPSYPYMQICKAGDVAILSRRPFSSEEPPRCFDRERLALARIDFGGEEVEIGALHLYWPWPFHQPVQIGGLRSTLGAISQTAIVAGDFNAVTWSNALRRVAQAGGLQPLAGVRPSWIPIQLPDLLRRFVGLPIDQVLAKGRIVLRSVATADDAGSDHLPVLVRFSVTPGKADAPGEAEPQSVQMRGDARPAAAGGTF